MKNFAMPNAVNPVRTDVFTFSPFTHLITQKRFSTRVRQAVSDHVYRTVLPILLMAGLTFSVQGQNVTVNPGAGSYATLKAAFDAINAGTHTGAITIDVVGNTTETAPAVLNASGSGAANYSSILIQPSGGAGRTISGAIVAGSPLIDLNGSDNVTFDGLNSGGNSLTLSNTTASATSGTSTIRLIGGASSNVITRCSVQGSFSAAVATNGGNIFISTDAVTGNGNDNNTISFCDIGPAGSSLPTKGVYANGSTTTTTNYNSGNIITNNNIFDYFGAAVTSAGVYVAGGNTDFTISNNKLYQTATRTQTTGSIHAGIQLASTNINNCTISGNTIGFSTAGGTGTYTIIGVSSSSRMYPIYLSSHGTTTATSIQGNLISNISMSGSISGTSTSAPFAAILISSGLANIGNVNGNTIGSSSVNNAIVVSSSSASAGDVYGIYFFPSQSVNISNNSIGGMEVTNTSTGGIDFYGIRANTSTGSVNTIQNNTIGYSTGTIVNNATSTASNTFGIYSESGASQVSGNIVRNMTMQAANIGTGTSSSMVGILNTNTSTTGANSISGNTVHSLSNTNGAAAVIVAGILYNGPTTGTHSVHQNVIHSINVSSTSATADIRGISVIAGAATYSNNQVRLGIDAAGASIVGGSLIHGIYDNNTSSNSYYFNTVYVGGMNVGGTGNTHAFRSDGATNTRIFKNNIFHNARANGAGTGKHYGIRLGGTGVNPTGLTSNRNVLRADGTGGFLGFYDGVDRVNLGAWSAATGQDANSIEETPDYINATGNAASVNLKIDITTATNIESGGENITGITTDFEGDIRQGNPGYAGSGTAPDIGADEFNGMTPTCTGAPVASNALVTPTPPICPGASFTLSLDQSYTAVEFQWQSSPDNMTWSNIPGATFETHVTSSLVSTYYRAVITCPASMLSTNSNSVFVTVLAQLSGTYTINNTLPTGGTNYISFTDAVTDLNCRGVSGPVTFNVSAGQTFSSTDSLNILATGTSVNTITFVKFGAGANPKIQRSGNSAATNYILRIGGGDYITFDGIDFQQTGTMASDYVEYGVYIQNASVINGARNNTFKNGVITMAQGSSAMKGVYVHASPTPTAGTGTNSYNQFLNMTVQNSFEGYRIAGATNTFPDTSNIIDIQGGGTSRIWNMGDGVATGSVYGVFATYQVGFKVANTDIAGLLPGGTSLAYGIAMQTSSTNSAVLSGNIIREMSGGGTITGIQLSSGDTITIDNNQIYNLSTTGSGSALRGIDLSGTGLGALIRNNRIYSLSSTGITTTSVGGIDVATGTGYTLVNNMISGLTASASTNTTGGTKGIIVSGGSTGSTVKIYYNTVLLNDVAAVANYTSAGISNSSVTPTLDLRNNIIINNSDISTMGLRVAAFWKTSATDNVSTACNNNLYYAGMPSDSNLIYYDPSNAAQTMMTYTGLAAITPAEAFSVTENVDFATIIDGILRPDPMTATLVESNAAEIAGFTSDFESDARGPYPLGGQSNGGGFNPDIGADEGDFTFIAPAVPDCPTLNDPTNGEMDICAYQPVVLSWTPAITGGLPTLGYDVYFGTSMTPPLVTNTNANSYTVNSLLANTTYYWQIVPKNASGPAVGCAVYSFSTVNAQIASTTPGSRCGTGTVTLGATGSGTLNWYAASAGGSVLGTGTSFVTPVINTTTNFYVAASSGFSSGTVGPLNPASVGTVSSSTIAISTQQTFFNVEAPSVTINSVDVFPTAAIGSSFSIVIQNSSGTQIFTTGTLTTTVTGGNLQTVVLNATIPTGTGYRIGLGVNPGMNRNTTGAVYPYSIPGTISITGNSFDPVYYYFTYNWSVSYGCESPRTAVTATVTPADPINIMPVSVTRCEFDPASALTASSTYAYNYTWSPAAGLNMTSGASVLASPSSTTTYTVTGDDGVCANTASVVVTVNEAPDLPMASATPNPACVGSTVNFAASATVPSYIMNTSCGTGFIDISATGTNVPGALADDSEHNITFPSFSFNGVSYTSARVGMNGVIVLGSTTGEIANGNVVLPSTAHSAGNIFLAPYWDDLDIDIGPTIKTETVGSKFIIQYTNANHFSYTTGSITFQVQLDLVTGVITFVYQDVIFGSPTYDSGVNATVGIQFSSSSALQYSFNTASLTNGQCISFTPNTLSYIWNGPAGFSSMLQNPSLPMISASNDGIYTVSIEALNGCEVTTTVDLVVEPSPAISLGANPSVCAGITSANLTYSGVTNAPDQYSIDFNAGAEAQGFTDVVNAALPASPIVITVPGAAAPGTYNATLTVRNSTTTCASAAYPISVTILSTPNAGTVSGTMTLCVAATATYTSSGDPGGVWSSTNSMVASVNPMTGLVTALTPGTTDITYTVTNACGGPVSDFETLTVDPVEVENTNDSGAGSLRDIIACAGNGATITFDASLMSQMITLTSGEIVIDKDITLAGIGMMNLTISGNNATRIFQVQAGKTLRIEDMALKNATAMTNGGAVYVLGSLILENVLMENNEENGTPKALTVLNPAQLEVIGTVEMKE